MRLPMTREVAETLNEVASTPLLPRGRNRAEGPRRWVRLRRNQSR